MNRKKMSTLLIALGLITATSVIPQTNFNKVYANADGNVHVEPQESPLLTASGYVGEEYAPSPLNYQKGPEYLSKLPNVINLTPENNYGLLARKEGDFPDVSPFVLNVGAFNLTNNIYHVQFKLGSQHTDTFIFMVRMYINENNKVTRVFHLVDYSFGRVASYYQVYHSDVDDLGLGTEKSYDEPIYSKYLLKYHDVSQGIPSSNQYIGAPDGTTLVDADTSKDYVTSKVTTDKKNISNTRISGADRFKTSLAVAKQVIGDGTLDNVILANGYGYADALTGATLAKKVNSPIFLIGNPEQNEETLNYIASKLSKNGHIYMLGGSAVMPDSIKSWFIDHGYSADNIKRLGGTNREGTANAIVNEVSVQSGTPVIIASEENYPDALSMSAVATKNGYPILIVPHNSLPAYASKYLSTNKPSKVYVAGGTGSINDSVVQSILKASGLSSSSIERIGGDNRFVTSRMIGERFFGGTNKATIANGYNFPDALSGSVFAGKNDSPIILSDQDYDSNTRLYINTLSAKDGQIYFLGGTGAISQKSTVSLTTILDGYDKTKLDKIVDSYPAGENIY